MNSKQPFDEMPDPLRAAVNSVRAEPVPAEALDRAQRRGPVKPKPWYRRERSLLALAGAAAAVLLLGYALWVNRARLGPRQVAVVDNSRSMGGKNDVEAPAKELDLSNIELGDGTGEEINYDVGRDKQEFSTPGEVNPNAPPGIRGGSEDAPKVSVPPPGKGNGTGQGGAFYRAGGIGGRSGATKKKLLQAGGSGDRKPRDANLRWDPITGKPLNTEGEKEHNTEAYAHIVDNPFRLAIRHPLSTFSSDVHTASYSNVRRFLLQEHRLPPPDAVRIAELINYFPYRYQPPKGNRPVAFALDLADCPWNPRHHLLRIGVKGQVIDPDHLPPRNLVFLVDTSGSMDAPNRLPLLKESLKMLVAQLGPRDRVALVAYAGSAGLVLPSTPGSEKQTILDALDRLSAGGSTNGGEGIVLAYKVARDNFLKEGVNRVVLGTDGDFNVGVTSEGDLIRLIEEQRNSGVFLTLLGYGMGNLKDATLEKLAYHGAGHYAYIDTPAEARKVFVEQGAALHTIARDVKLQVEFNPRRVAAYRLIGYENRLMRAEDFNDDRKHAGSIGVGHTVTALYEIVPVGEAPPVKEQDDLKYQRPASQTKAADSDEWLTVKMRYKHPEADKSKLLTQALSGPVQKLDRMPADFRFAAAVAELGMVLRKSEHRGGASLGGVHKLAKDALGPDANGHRAEFVRLVDAAIAIARQQIEKRGNSDKQ